MGAGTPHPAIVEYRSIVEADMSRTFETRCSAAEIVKKTRETIATTRELLAEVDRVLARR